jgi:hypothetical protein
MQPVSYVIVLNSFSFLKSSSNVAMLDIPFALQAARLVQSVKLSTGFLYRVKILQAEFNASSSILRTRFAPRSF